MKKLILLTTIMCMLMAVFCYGGETVTVTVDGKSISGDTPAQIIDGRTLVPLRAIFEAIGADVEWNGEEKSVSANKGDTSVYMKINDKSFKVNNSKKILDVPAAIIDGRTMVPARAISESFGCDVQWDKKTKTVIITTAQADSSVDLDDRELVSGSANGEGVMDFGEAIYTGELKNGKCNGQGRMEFNSGEGSDTKYIDGQWINDQPEGYVEMASFNGDVYKGYVKDGLFNGQGTFTYAEGNSVTCNWIDGEQDGETKIETKEGNYIISQYDNGELVKGTSTAHSKDGTVKKVEYDKDRGWYVIDESSGDSAEPKNISITPIDGTEGANSGEEFVNLFDRNAATKWCVTEFNQKGEAYAIWEMSSPVAATGYKIVTANDNSRYKGRNPLDWQLYGCNSSSAPRRNSGAWEVVDSRSDQGLADEDYEEYSYKISGSVPEYNYYMLVVTATDGAKVMQISEFAVLYDGCDYSYVIDSSGSLSSGSYSGGDSYDFSPGSNGDSICTFCGGTGSRTCSVCGGDGQVEDTITTPNYSGRPGGGGTRRSTRRCPNVMCHGGSVDCTYCGGDGRR